jgi:phage baseplate assembly protein W
MADFGFSIDGTTDTAKTWAIVGGAKNLGNAIARRLTTPTASLFYDLGYGFDVRQLLNAPLGQATRQQVARKIEEQCLQDERIAEATATLTAAGPQEIRISVVGTLSDDASFTLVLSVTSLTVALLTAEST